MSDETQELPAIWWGRCYCCGWEKEGPAPKGEANFLCLECRGHAR